MRRLQGLFRLFRFELPFAAGVSVLMGELLALGRFPAVGDMAAGFLSVFFISASALILNDYFDIESDRINAPERPLPSGQVSPQDVIILSIVVTILGLAISYWSGLAALLVAGLVWLVGFLYNWRFKQTGLPGNLKKTFFIPTFQNGCRNFWQKSDPVCWAFRSITWKRGSSFRVYVALLPASTLSIPSPSRIIRMRWHSTSRSPG